MRLVADLHVHTVASGHAYSTILEITRAAEARGLAMVAITDHGPAMPGGPHLYHFGNLAVVPPSLSGVRLLKGVEANIIDHDGGLDMPERYLRSLDIVLVGLHAVCTPLGTREQNTHAMVQAMHNPFVDIIVHPGNPEYPVDYEAVVKASVETGVAIEINNSSLRGSRKGSKPHCHDIACLAAEYGCLISIGSDCHFALDVGRFDEAIALCKAAGIQEKQIINTSLEKIYNYLEMRRKRYPAKKEPD
ncbi:MAG TPA: phosphatase [Bacillota bacterium]|nr:phosphatase [Bacillota bacterium]